MRRGIHRPIPACLLAVLILAPSLPAPAAGEETRQAQEEPPRSIDLVEHARSRLAQLDVTVRGPRGFVSDLTKEDFELRVGGRFLENFIVDQVCRPAPPPETASTGTVPSPPSSPAAGSTPADLPSRTAPATYVFFFDQPHLTMAGRRESIDIASTLVEGLMDGTAQAMIVSNARKLKVVQEMTRDREKLLNALDRLQVDREQWSTWATEEESRLDEVLDSLDRDNNVEKSIGLAKKYQIEEAWMAEKSMQRLDMVLGRLAELDPPKALVYFADTMRKNPGEHYLGFFGKRVMAAEVSARSIETGALLSGNSLDRIIHQASAMGIRFYTVQGEGMTAESMATFGRGAKSKDPGANTRRIRDAQNTMADLALETGGASFLNGVRAEKILRRIRTDLECLYLVSFPVEGWPEDQPLPIRLTTSRKKVTVQTRGRLVIQSPAAERTARILSAFATSGENISERRISALVVPTGYENGLFSALVQISVPGSKVPGATWDLGASLVTGETVREDYSGRVVAASPGVRVIFEKEMKFPPGKYELVAVAHETTTDQIFSRSFEGEWPNPNQAPASLSPIAVLQPESAAFLREGKVRNSGPLGYLATSPVRTTKPTALIGLVCRSRNNHHELEISRVLAGDSSAEFPVLTFPAKDPARCIQYRDLVPPGAMTEGEFRFQVKVTENEEELAAVERKFAAVAEISADR